MTDRATASSTANAATETADAPILDSSKTPQADPRIRTVVRGGKAYSMNTVNIGKWRRANKMGREPVDALIDLAMRFGHSPPKADHPKRHELIRAHALSFASQIVAICPDSRERAAALNHIDTAMLFANAAIARHA